MRYLPAACAGCGQRYTCSCKPLAQTFEAPHTPTIAEQEQFWTEAPASIDLAPTIAELIDRLCIVHCKMFALIDVVGSDQDDAKVADAARKTHALNKERSQLKNAIERAISGAGAKQEVKVS